MAKPDAWRAYSTTLSIGISRTSKLQRGAGGAWRSSAGVEAAGDAGTASDAQEARSAVPASVTLRCHANALPIVPSPLVDRFAGVSRDCPPAGTAPCSLGLN